MMMMMMKNWAKRKKRTFSCFNVAAAVTKRTHNFAMSLSITHFLMSNKTSKYTKNTFFSLLFRLQHIYLCIVGSSKKIKNNFLWFRFVFFGACYWNQHQQPHMLERTNKNALFLVRREIKLIKQEKMAI